jgi:predicted PhzF superfamily epimerase YddE/YHI9
MPATVTIYQGYDMGRPGTISVCIPAGPQTGIEVSGPAVPI